MVPAGIVTVFGLGGSGGAGFGAGVDVVAACCGVEGGGGGGGSCTISGWFTGGGGVCCCACCTGAGVGAVAGGVDFATVTGRSYGVGFGFFGVFGMTGSATAGSGGTFVATGVSVGAAGVSWLATTGLAAGSAGLFADWPMKYAAPPATKTPSAKAMNVFGFMWRKDPPNLENVCDATLVSKNSSRYNGMRWRLFPPASASAPIPLLQRPFSRPWRE